LRHQGVGGSSGTEIDGFVRLVRGAKKKPAIAAVTLPPKKQDDLATSGDGALAVMFAEIDRRLDASEQRTARLLTAHG